MVLFCIGTSVHTASSGPLSPKKPRAKNEEGKRNTQSAQKNAALAESREANPKTNEQIKKTHHLSGVEVVLEEHGDTGGLDGDAAVLLVLPGVGEAGLSRVLGGDDACLRHERVSQRGLAVVYVRDHGHVPDVVLLVHDLTELVRREVNLRASSSSCKEKTEQERYQPDEAKTEPGELDERPRTIFPKQLFPPAGNKLPRETQPG